MVNLMVQDHSVPEPATLGDVMSMNSMHDSSESCMQDSQRSHRSGASGDGLFREEGKDLINVSII